MNTEYAELHCLSNFTFLRGASQPRELVTRASEQGYRALAITDECSLAGVVRAHEAALALDLQLIIGIEVTLEDGLKLVLLATSHRGYSALCRLVTIGRRAAPKGRYRLERKDLQTGLPGCLALWLPASAADPEQGQWLRETFPERCWISVELLHNGADQQRLAELENLALDLGLPRVASGDVHMHQRGRRALQDTLTAIRLGCPVTESGFALHPNGERHLRSIPVLSRIYPAALLQETVRIAERCQFSLADLDYQYPEELVPQGFSATQHLRQLTQAGARRRWPEGMSAAVRKQIDYELDLIAEMSYESFFLTVDDIGGSAANSAVCYCLGITEVDPARMQMLFERFISRERNEPPDIDVDFEHDRREEVIQYIYRKYGRHRAALAATVVTYRAKSAVREVAKALGLDAEQVERLARALTRWDCHEVLAERLHERGFDPDTPLIRRLLVLVDQLIGFPRHLSQHVGGFVISQDPLHHLVPVENAAMPDRTIIQWDKDDLEALGLLKVDCLALGMLSAIHRSFDLIHAWRGQRYTLATVPAEDPTVYQMIQQADTVGVFQIESRAQMSMLPRLKPACYYDLVIEVAIVRPGPIQGKMVHPYLRRRQGLEPVSYPNEALRDVFERTLGVPIFQEQVMKLAIVAAGFTPGEADQLRRSMAAWKRHGGLEQFERRIVDGMSERGYDASFARQVFEQIKGFGSYGFPESHAASFALLVYVSAWLKCHEPAAFCCALLNSLPMGFYPASQLIQDARNHNVAVYPPDVSDSHWDCHLQADSRGEPGIRLGFRQIKGLREQAAHRIVEQRCIRPFSDIQDLVDRCRLDRHARNRLADADALKSLAGNRHQARWAVNGVETFPEILKGSRIYEAPLQLRPPSVAEEVLTDYANLGLSLKKHPLALLRKQLAERRVLPISSVREMPNKSKVRSAGLVTLRQRPGTASGVTFLTLEDETGMLNVIVWRELGARQRRTLIESDLLAIDGVIENQQGVQHLIAHQLHCFDELIGDLKSSARNFC
jgi:error-prone DNA polymerase